MEFFMAWNRRLHGSAPLVILFFTKSNSSLEFSSPGWVKVRGEIRDWFDGAAWLWTQLRNARRKNRTKQVRLSLRRPPKRSRLSV